MRHLLAIAGLERSDIDRIMEHAKELVRIEYTLKQVVNCKGD